MNALSLTPPWGTLIAIGAKRFETRSWPLPAACIGQPLAIHQTKGLAGLGGEAGYRALLSRRVFGEALLAGNIRWETQIARGAIIAVVVPIACYRITASGLHAHGTTRPLPDERERSFGDYTPGRWAWEFAEVQRFATRVACRGMQGIWAVPPDVEAQIIAELAISAS